MCRACAGLCGGLGVPRRGQPVPIGAVAHSAHAPLDLPRVRCSACCLHADKTKWRKTKTPTLPRLAFIDARS